MSCKDKCKLLLAITKGQTKGWEGDGHGDMVFEIGPSLYRYAMQDSGSGHTDADCLVSSSLPLPTAQCSSRSYIVSLFIIKEHQLPQSQLLLL